MNIKKILISAAASALLFGSVAGAAFAVGSNGSFEGSYTGQTFDTLVAPNSSIAGWNVDTGSVDWIGNYWVASDLQRSIDLNGLTTGSISQTLTTVAGGKYNVTFDLSGNPDSRSDVNDPYYSPSNKQVTINATGGGSPATYSYDTSAKGNSLTNMMWENHSYSFVATGTSSTLSFTSTIPGAFGPALDNVVITEILPTVNDCKKDGWKNLNDGQGHKFKNQGDCVSFFATQGKNLGAGPTVTP